MKQLVTSSPYYDNTDPPELQFRHDLVRAKLAGFLDKPEIAFNRYPASDTSLAAVYARAIATYRSSGVKAAMPMFDQLIAAQPNWPYFYETKGQFLFESGNGAAAIPPLRKAVELAPNEPLIRIMLGQALLGANDPRYLDEAIRQFAHGARARDDIGDGLSPDRFRLCAQGRPRQSPGRQEEFHGASITCIGGSLFL